MREKDDLSGLYPRPNNESCPTTGWYNKITTANAAAILPGHPPCTQLHSLLPKYLKKNSMLNQTTTTISR